MLAAGFVGPLIDRLAARPDVAAVRPALQAAPDFTPALVYLGACYAAEARDQQAASAWQMALLHERSLPDLPRLTIEARLRANEPAAAIALLTTLERPDASTVLLALTKLHEASRRQTPVWNAARDLETMRRLRETYAALHGASLSLVDTWLQEMGSARP